MAVAGGLPDPAELRTTGSGKAIGRDAAKTRRSRVHAKIPDSCQSSKVGSGRRLHRPCLHEQAALH
jgi:hypothetical protein